MCSTFSANLFFWFYVFSAQLKINNKNSFLNNSMKHYLLFFYAGHEVKYAPNLST